MPADTAEMQLEAADHERTVRAARTVAVFALIAVLSAIDWWTGPDMTFEFLYLVPVVWLAWTVGAAAGVAAATVAVVAGTLLDWLWPQVEGLDVYLWNATTRAAMLVFSALAVARIHRIGDLLSNANARLGELLATETRARAETEVNFGLVVNALQDYAIVLFDATGASLRWSAATPRIAGADSTAIAGRTLDALFPPTEPEPEAAVTGALPGDRTEVERWTRRANGDRYWANIVRYQLEGGRALAIVRDATGRKLAEDAIRHARDDALAANRELETFSYTVAHDLRAPLRAIDGFGALLEQDLAEHLQDRTRTYLDRMREAVRRMGRLIDDLLEMSRLGRAPVRRAKVDLTALARGIERQLRERDPGRRVDLSVAENLTMEADPRLIEVVLRNLLENAWKFTSRQEAARIEVGVEPRSPPVFYVRDNGVGFDMAFVDRLFRPFERLHTVDEFEGTGIGLATVRRLVERHGGRAWAEGAIDRGATVYFTLPPRGERDGS
jgi:PAS domain S-box-containing protein